MARKKARDTHTLERIARNYHRYTKGNPLKRIYDQMRDCPINNFTEIDEQKKIIRSMLADKITYNEVIGWIEEIKKLDDELINLVAAIDKEHISSIDDEEFTIKFFKLFYLQRDITKKITRFNEEKEAIFRRYLRVIREKIFSYDN